MGRKRATLRIGALIVAWMLPLMFVAAKSLTASLYTPKTTTRVKIGDIDYGPFDRIDGLDQFGKQGQPLRKDKSYVEVVLSRDFVTDPSLYLWAHKRMSRKSELQNIELIVEDEKGSVVSKRVLELCHPLTWTVESKSPSMGGFNETIALAVRQVTVF